jgi:hypothetical protein
VKKQTRESGSDGLTSHLQRDRSELEKSFLRWRPNVLLRDEWRSSRRSWIYFFFLGRDANITSPQESGKEKLGSGTLEEYSMQRC